MAVDRRTQREFLLGVCASVALAAAGILLLAHSRAGDWLESGTLDARARFSAKPSEADPRIVIIDADNASLETLQDKLGRWPWTRRVWTEVIRYVNQGQPRAIAMDAIFSGAESDAVDADFASVLKQNGNTVLGFTFVPTQMEQEDGNSDATKLDALQQHQASAQRVRHGGLRQRFLPQSAGAGISRQCRRPGRAQRPARRRRRRSTRRCSVPVRRPSV
jgi:CHASE2 domain-containing sensor protein